MEYEKKLFYSQTQTLIDEFGLIHYITYYNLDEPEIKQESSETFVDTYYTNDESKSDQKYAWKTGQYINKHPSILKQSSYVISVISEADFIRRGALPLDFGLYYIKKEYNGSSEQETVALVGIPMLHVSHFFEDESDLIRKIRNLEQLNYIDNVAELCCSQTSETLKKFKKFFDSCESHYLLLLNIEPVGEGKYRRIYPFPRFTLPGGKMESQDCGDFLQCALREFKEETHIDLNNNYRIILQKKIVKDIKGKRKRTFNIFDTVKPTKVVCFYFAIKLLS